MNFNKYRHIWLLLLLLIPVGLGTKFYCGNHYFWVNNSLSDILYEIFWSLLLFLIFPKLKPIFNVCIIFTVTSLIEFSQLLSNPFLDNLRSNFWGRTLLGTTFVAADFIYYAIGCLISYTIITIHRKSTD